MVYRYFLSTYSRPVYNKLTVANTDNVYFSGTAKAKTSITMQPASRVLQYVCFYPIEIPTQQGDAYFYCFVDAFSQFAFTHQVEAEFNGDLLLSHVTLLCSENKDFAKALQSQGSFTLVFHKYGHLLPQINELLRPLGGNAIVDASLVDKVMIPFMEHFFERMMSRG